MPSGINLRSHCGAVWGDNLVTKTEKDSDITTELVRISLYRILSNKRFEASPRIKRLLTFIVEAKLTGRSQLKSYTLGVEVFDRCESHDPQTDSIVRTSTVRLRKMLDAYYAEEGRGECIRIVLNKGGYLPVFAYAPALEPGVREGSDRILLAVERLEWIGDAAGLEYLSAGLAEELIASLSGYGEKFIVVLAADAANTQPRVSCDLQNPGLSSYSLRGTIRVSGDDMRINFTLLEGEAGVVNWCETFFARLSPSGLFEFQEEVARKVASTVLDPHGIIYASLKRKPAALLGTYLAVFLYHEYEKCFTPNTHLRSREELESAIREDPDYADAWAALANIYLGEALFGFNQTSTLSCLIEKVVSTAQKAVALEPRNVIANYILAMALFYRKDRAQFLAMAEHSLKLAPSRPDNLATIGMHLLLAGEWERGLRLVETAMKLNPYHPNWYYLVLSLYHLHGHHYPEALTSINRFAALDFFPFQVNLAVIHGYLDNEAEARQALGRMFALWPASAQNIKEILAFWFPFGDLAEVFKEGLMKAGFSMGN